MRHEENDNDFDDEIIEPINSEDFLEESDSLSPLEENNGERRKKKSTSQDLLLLQDYMKKSF